MEVTNKSKLNGPMRFLLLGVLLSHLGTYMVTPMLPITLKMDAGLTLVQIGAILAAIAISFQFGSIIGGVLADRLGRGVVIGLGAIIAAGGFIGFGFFEGFTWLLVMAVITGLGNGINAPSTKAAIAALASTENRTTAFSMRGIAANIGVGSAGLIIFFLITGSTKIIFWIAGIIYIILALVSWFFIPNRCGEAPCPPVPIKSYGEVLKNKPFLVFGGVSILIWALYAQLSLALPLVATEILPDPKNVALVWTINSAIVILFQRAVTKYFINRLHPLTALAIGVLVVGIGVGSLYFSSSFIHLVFSGAIFVFGEMMILPTVDSTVSQLSKAQLIGVFFALANVVSGLGEAAGKSVGSRLLEVGSVTPWLTYALTGVSLFFIVLLLKRWNPLNRSLIDAAKSEDKPESAPRVPIIPSQNRSHPYNDWVPEIFFRRKPHTEN
ncbi:MFS transporter [Cytobacillus sp. FJAT-54145]|uniref:MFS transporter n=1 Tax=Cytobacillus spartinae TaxID=3299023 RepID=A0ABW6KJP6_9BACI